MERVLKGLFDELPDALPSQHVVSSRERFQWNCLGLVEEGAHVLNVGSCDDPMGFGPLAIHFDLDDWTERYWDKSVEYKEVVPFIQGDVHQLALMFGKGLFDLVILGDIVEHLYNPVEALKQAALVTNRYLCITIWEEWRVESPEACAQGLQEEADVAGFANYTELYAARHEGVVPVDNVKVPHLGHLHAFTDEDVNGLVGGLVGLGMHVVAFYKVPETVHEGHTCMNWCILLSWDQEDVDR